MCSIGWGECHCRLTFARAKWSSRTVANYQTVYATAPGAVAAPTAGLHFTPELLQELQERGIDRREVTLHVGLDTFRPITAETLDQHKMHSEWGEISDRRRRLPYARRAAGGRIVAVGTTSVRSAGNCRASGEIGRLVGQY